MSRVARLERVRRRMAPATTTRGAARDASSSWFTNDAWRRPRARDVANHTDDDENERGMSMTTMDKAHRRERGVIRAAPSAWTCRRAMLASTSASMGDDASRAVVRFVAEPRTGLKIPESTRFGDALLTLRAKGARIKRIAGVGIKVYACGIYVNTRDVREAMRAVFGAGASMGEMAESERAFDALRRCERAARLVFARDVGGDKIADALAERIRPALGANSKSLHRFEALFNGVTFQKGASLDFHAKIGGALETRIRGQSIGVIHDQALCDALFDAYLGTKPVIPSIKDDMRAWLASVVL